jgi:hypothetical protein
MHVVNVGVSLAEFELLRVFTSQLHCYTNDTLTPPLECCIGTLARWLGIVRSHLQGKIQSDSKTKIYFFGGAVAATTGPANLCVPCDERYVLCLFFWLFLPCQLLSILFLHDGAVFFTKHSLARVSIVRVPFVQRNDRTEAVSKTVGHQGLPNA